MRNWDIDPMDLATIELIEDSAILFEFLSPKCPSAIGLPSAQALRGMIQLSLDPAVKTIVQEVVGAERVALIGGDAGERCLLINRIGVSEAAAARAAKMASDRLARDVFVITGEDIDRQPRALNSSLVWRSRNLRVGPSDRLRLMGALKTEKSLPLEELLQAVGLASDPAAAVFSLVCEDIFEMDLSREPIGPGSIVRWRVHQ